MEKIRRLPVNQLAEKLQAAENVDTVIFDGIITQRLVDVANKKKVKYLIAARISNTIKPSHGVHLVNFAEINV